MHLCLVSNEYPPANHGGIGSTNRDLAEGMAFAGHKVTVVGVYPRGEINRVAALEREKSLSSKHPGVRIVRIPMTEGRHLWHQRSLWDRLRLKRWLSQTHAREHFDILEFTDNDGWLPWGGPKNLPSVVRIHGTNLAFDRELGWESDPFVYRLEERTLHSAHHWLAVSQFSVDMARAVSGAPRTMGAISYSPVDTDFFAPKSEAIVENGLIVFVNSVGPRKGVNELIIAANSLLPRYPRARLVLIGADVGPKYNGLTYTDQMKAKLHPEIASRVVFTGRLNRNTELLPFLQKAHVCCYPSHCESLGLGPIEAMACGKAVVYTRFPPGPEVIEHGVSGLLCNPKDPADIAATLSRVLDDSQIAGRLGRAARRRVLERFNRSDWILYNISFFEQCIRTSQATAK